MRATKPPDCEHSLFADVITNKVLCAVKGKRFHEQIQANTKLIHMYNKQIQIQAVIVRAIKTRETMKNRSAQRLSGRAMASPER